MEYTEGWTTVAFDIWHLAFGIRHSESTMQRLPAPPPDVTLASPVAN